MFINEYLNPSGRGFQAVLEKIAALQNQQTITQAQYDAINSERDAIRNTYNINGAPKATELGEIYNSLSETEKRALAGPYVLRSIADKVLAGAALSQQTRQQLNALQVKIEGRGEGE